MADEGGPTSNYEPGFALFGRGRMGTREVRMSACEREIREFEAEGGQVVIDKTGVVRWYRDGVLHRDNGPAVEGLAGWQMARIMLEPGPLTSEPRLRRVYGSGQVTCA